MTSSSRKRLRTTVWSSLFVLTSIAFGEEVRPGVWAGRDVAALPLPVSGCDVFMLGELHGIEENARIFSSYLVKLGIRDVALEEDAVYEPEAQAYLDGRSAALPPELCLRANILRSVRGRGIRVHLVDIDSPLAAIDRHLTAIRTALGAPSSSTIEQLRALTTNPKLLGELRTVQHSLRALQQGFEVGTQSSRGSPYLEEREEAIASNIHNIGRPVLVFYGSDHVSKARRNDGGPDRNQSFRPVALRLQDSGLRVCSVAMFPLAATVNWRGRRMDMPWTAADGKLQGGEPLDHLLASVGEGNLIYIDRRRQRLRLPSTDASRFDIDGWLLMPNGTPLRDECR